MVVLDSPRGEAQKAPEQSGVTPVPPHFSNNPLNTSFFTPLRRYINGARNAIKPADRLNWVGSTAIDWAIGKFLSSQIAMASTSFIVGLLAPASAFTPMFAGMVAIAVLGMTFGAAYSTPQNYREAGPALNAFRAIGVGQLFGTAAYFLNPALATIGPLLFYYVFCPTRTAFNALATPSTYAKSGSLLIGTVKVLAWPVTTLWSLITERSSKPLNPQNT